MAAVLGLYGMFKSFLDMAKEFESKRYNWYHLSDDYGKQVEILEAELRFYQGLMVYRQLPSNHFTMVKLRQASTKMGEVSKNLKWLDDHINSDRCGCCGWGWWFWAKLTVTLFPERLEQKIKEVVEQIKSIPEELKTKGTFVSQMQQQDALQPVRIPITDNGRHVPLQKTQDKVIREIENEDHGVVFLQGEVGTGKTILARCVYMHFDKARDSEESKFDLVHFEPRCPDTSRDSWTKMFDILEKLCPILVGHDFDKKSPARIADTFHNFLVHNRILIILDDVSDGDFLYKMSEAARESPGVKYLVTSQTPNLCCNSLTKGTWTEVPMPAVTKGEARKILASLVGLEGKGIPTALKKVADLVITATERNPLALACWAGRFQGAASKKDEYAWKHGYDNLHIVLNDQEKGVVLGSNERRRLWEAMELSIKSLETPDATLIFFLMYASPGALVPEEVLNIWFEYVNLKRHRSAASSAISLRELSSRGLLVDGSRLKLLRKHGNYAKAWFLRPLVTLYMKHVMASTETQKEKKKGTETKSTGENILDAMSNFLGDDDLLEECSKPDKSKKTEKSEKEKVAIALCGLYFDANHGDENVKDLATKAQSASNIKDVDPTVINRRKQAVEPIIRLLGTPETHEDLSSARKVFLAYICENRLDCESSTLLLLHSPATAQLATLTALLSIVNIDEKLVRCENVRRILEALLVLVDSKADHPSDIKEASFNLLKVILRSICNSLRKPEKPDLQVVLALTVLEFGDEDSIERKVMKEDRAVSDLVTSLCQQGEGDLTEQVGDLTEQVTWALRKILSETDQSTLLKTANEEGVVAGLAKALSEDEKSGLQGNALFALMHLSGLEDRSARSLIANKEGVLAGLVMFLTKDKDSVLQGTAARALANLALSDDGGRRMVNEPGLVPGLVECLSVHNSTDTRCSAASALASLAHGKIMVDHNKSGIANEAGAMDHNKSVIANEAGALAGLAQCLSERDKPELRQKAAKVFRNIASAKAVFIKQKIIDRALAGLVDCLYDEEPSLQARAARSIQNLARTEDSKLKERIRNENRLLPGLKSMSKQDDSSCQKAQAALKALEIL